MDKKNLIIKLFKSLRGEKDCNFVVSEICIFLMFDFIIILFVTLNGIRIKL